MKSSNAPAPLSQPKRQQPSVQEAISFPRLHTGRQLARISCPLGGIGTGGIGLGGRGNLQDWQIFNRPDYGNSLEYAFPAIWVKTGAADPFAAVLERRLLPPYDLQQEGLGFANVPGLPRFAEARFHGSFPLSRIDFDDPVCPVHVALEAFSPFQPLDADASGLPVAILSYEVRNPGPAPAEVAVAWSIANPVGTADTRRNQPRTGSGLTGLLMTDTELPAADTLKGSFVLAALPESGAEIETLPAWRGGAIWRVGPQDFWFENFAPKGHLGAPAEPSTPVGSVLIRQSVPAGATRRFRFLLAWHFPNRTPARCGWDAPKGQEQALLGNHYSTRFADAWAAAEFAAKNLPALEGATRAFVAEVGASTLPAAVKDAATANLTTLVSNTSFRIADGSFHGFEGCGDKGGLGFGTCTHVWNYEVATQFLFPALARSLRETSFGYATDAEGHMDFRHKLPLGQEHWGAAAADGQMGQIVKLWLDWTLLGDDGWLRRQWPAAKRALEYAWRPGGWDERRSGVMDGVQHNTCDVEYYGPNPMCSSWYLAALRAAARMARAMGEAGFAAECERMAEEGARWIDRNLFNGEFYVQQIRGIPADKIASGLIEGMGARDSMKPDFQVGGGCYADQLVGQYMASVAGLGDLLDPAHIRTTLASIWRLNFRRDLSRHASAQRVYALNDEGALIVVDYSKGGRPEVPMPYYAENWTGMEHSVAALLMAHGMVSEGVELVENVRRRYDGERANPYDETEYGRHYARAMASWAAFPVLSGFAWDARAGSLTLAPRLAVSPFRCFWSAPQAWGSFTLGARALELKVNAGSLPLKELTLAPFAPGKLTAASGRATVQCTASPAGKGTRILFAAPLAVDPGHPLTVRA
ncbi:MAG: GH116 family glycosyl-hydrolase [Terracidiphilus sp.]